MAYKQKHIALLGLAANPPHLGHLWIAKQILKRAEADLSTEAQRAKVEALAKADLSTDLSVEARKAEVEALAKVDLSTEALAKVDEVWFIPAYDHCLKHKLWPWRHRWNMTKLMERKHIRAYDIESRLDPPSYTFQTVKFLKKKFRARKFSWIVGSDIFRKGEIDTWDKWHSYLKKNINFLVVLRPGYPLAKDCDNLTENFKIIKLPYSRTRHISSTLIRKKLKNGLSVKGLVTKEVEEYIGKWFDKKTQKWAS